MKLKEYSGIIGASTGIAGLVLAIVLGVVNYNLNVENKNLYLESLRADINVFIEPIANQNWTFTSDGAYFEIEGLLVNEGQRTTQIDRAQLNLTFQFPDGGGEYVFTFNSNVSKGIIMEDYTVEENGKRAIKFADFIMTHMVVSKISGQVMQIGNTKPSKVSVTVWYNDNIGERSSYSETY